jgi:hypothetical protein
MSKDIVTIENKNKKPFRQTKRSKVQEIRALLTKNFGSLDSYQDNPYLTRKIRQESRNGRPILSTAFPAIFTLAVFWLIMYLLGPSIKHPMGYQWRHYPEMSIAKILAIMATMIYGLSVIIVAGRRARKFHPEETASNTFEQLLIFPQKPSEHLYKMAVHPFLVGMMIAVSALPFFIVVWGMGGVSLGQLISIYLIFASFSLIFPTLSYLNARYAVYQRKKPVTTEINRRKRGSIIALAWAIFWTGSHIIFSTFGRPIANAFSWLFQ